jgi:hypothetical protein
MPLGPVGLLELELHEVMRARPDRRKTEAAVTIHIFFFMNPSSPLIVMSIHDDCRF